MCGRSFKSRGLGLLAVLLYWLLSRLSGPNFLLVEFGLLVVVVLLLLFESSSREESDRAKGFLCWKESLLAGLALLLWVIPGPKRLVDGLVLVLAWLLWRLLLE